jgi:HEAT repeat protein
MDCEHPSPRSSAMHVQARLILLLGLLMSGGCGKSKSTDELLTDLKSGQERDRIIAVRLLPQRNADAAKILPVMIECLTDKETDIRLSAAIGLGSLGEKAKSAIPDLQSAQSDRDPRVRRAAGTALSRIDPSLAPKTDPSERSKK